MPQVHRLRRPDTRLGPVLQVALQLRRLRLVLPAAQQGAGLSRVRARLQALGAEGDDTVRQLQKVSGASSSSLGGGNSVDS